MNDRMVRTVQRSAPWWVLGLLFLLGSIPAIFDLESLFVGLAVVCWLIAGTIAGFTWFGWKSA